MWFLNQLFARCTVRIYQLIVFVLLNYVFRFATLIHANLVHFYHFSGTACLCFELNAENSVCALFSAAVVIDFSILKCI